LRALSTDHPTLVTATTMLAQQLMHERRTDEAREVVRRALEGGTPAVELAWIQSMLGKFVRGPEWSRTHVHESAHYRVRSDIDPQTCYDAARVLEAALRAYGRDLGKLAKGERRFDVYIFSGEAGYLAYVSDVLRSEPHNTAGLYTNTLEQLLIWNLPDRERMLQTVRHEGFHQYLDGLLDADQAPRWLNEGMAEYYEVHDLAAGDRERGVPHRENLQVLHYLRLPPLDEFIYLAPSEFYDPPTNYCVAWLLVHYLLHSNDRARGVFDDLMSRLAAGETRVEAVRGAFARFGAGELQSEAALHLTGLQRQSRR
jgi:hypothetical protein